jgi:glycosyltransferase 2 family protein
VWQYASRTVAYRQLGASYGTIRDALIVETLWVVGAAVIVGACLGASTVWRAGWDVIRPYTSGILILAFVGCVAAVWVMARYHSFAWRLIEFVRPTPYIVAVQAGVWLALGCSLWVILQALGVSTGLLYATGLFAGAYAVGVAVPIAPAGLGVRDAVLVAGLLDSGPAVKILLAVLLSRLIYTCTEIILVVTQEIWSILSKMSSSYRV